MACSDSDYAYLRQLVLTESANVIDPSRNSLFDARLRPVARLAGARDLEGLVDLLRVDDTTRLHRAVAEAMTINETSFFRDVAPLEHFPELLQWDVQIVGTDISGQVVEYATQGRYRRIEVNRGLPAKLLVKYMVRDGDEWEVVTGVRDRCRFVQGNLCAALPELPRFDLVLLRNVLLYFPQQDRRALFAMVAKQMRLGGYLLLGNAEQAEDSTSLFTPEFADNCYFYRPVE